VRKEGRKVTHKCDHCEGEVEKEKTDKIGGKTMAELFSVGEVVAVVDDVRWLLCDLHLQHLSLDQQSGREERSSRCRERCDVCPARRIG
jgi:3-keto-L-gulonate-6-phosphate decarboxylase